MSPTPATLASCCLHLRADHGRVMDLFAPNEDCLARACKDIGITVKQLHQDVRSIKEWMAQQPHLPVIKESLLVENMLLRCKGSVQATKKALDYHLSMRAAGPDIFANRDPLGEEIQGIFRHWTNFAMGHLTSEGYRARFIVIPPKESLEDFVDSALLKMGLMQFDLSLKEDINLGDVYIYDMRHLTFNHITRLTPMLLQRCYNIFMNGYKIRVKGFHLLNAPPLVDTLVTVMRTILPKKLAARLHVHLDLESLHKHVDRKILPKEYGGDEKPLLEQSNDWQKKIETYRDWFLDEDSWKVEESKRPPNSVNSSSDFFGFEGSFKKLQFD